MRITCIFMLAVLPCALALGQDKNFKNQSLSGMSQADFTDENLAGANFEAARLFTPQFVKSNLRNANFRDCTIIGGSFAAADLEGADFTGADLSTTSLAYARNLGKAIFRKTKLRNLDDTDLSGADLHGLDLTQAQFIKAILRGANLSHCNLAQADFNHADLRDANLSACDLAQADFRGADLRGADLTGATAMQARVDGADLSTAKGLDETMASRFLPANEPAKLPDGLPPLPELRHQEAKTLAELRAQPDMAGTDMRQMDLHEADLHELHMEGSGLPADLRDANFTDANATSILVDNADFSGADLRSANLQGAWLIGAKLRSAKNLGSANLSSCRLTESDFAGASAPGVKLSGSILRGANLSGAQLQHADLTGACLLGANLRGVDLSGAKMSSALVVDADFTGANLSGVDGEQLYGLSQAQLDQMAHKPASLPLRLDPVRRAAEAAGMNGSPHQTDHQLTHPSTAFLADGWVQNPMLRGRVLKRLGISMAVVIALLLLTLRMGMQAGFGQDDRWERIVGPYVKLASQSRLVQDVQVIPRNGARISPALDGPARELPLPLQVEIPPKIGPTGVRAFILLNGMVISLLIASVPIVLNFVFPIIGGSICLVVVLVWWLVLLQLRGKLIAADRSQVVVATLKARDPATAAKTQVLPTNQFSAVSYYYKGDNENFRTLELTTGGLIPTIIALGYYATEQAFAMRQCLGQSLKIADRDEVRQRSND